MDDLVGKLNQKVRDKQEEYSQWKDKLQKEVVQDRLMKVKMSSQAVSPDDIITLNVGGELMTTTRETLTQVHGSLLAAMFSGRREEMLTRDKEGRVFLDYDPTHFCAILSHLRTRLLDKKKALRIWQQKVDRDQALAMLGKYLVEFNPRFVGKYKDITISNGGTKVTRSGTDGADGAIPMLAEPVMKPGHVYYWKFVLVDLGSTPGFGLFGITTTWPATTECEYDPGCWGWNPGGSVLTGGKLHENLDHFPGFEHTDAPSFKLDLTRPGQGELSMWLPRRRWCYTLKGLATEEDYRILFFSCSQNSVVELCPDDLDASWETCR